MIEVKCIRWDCFNYYVKMLIFQYNERINNLFEMGCLWCDMIFVVLQKMFIWVVECNELLNGNVKILKMNCLVFD